MSHRSSGVKGIITGALIGAFAVKAFDMMNHKSRMKVREFAETSSQKVVDKANQLFGK